MFLTESMHQALYQEGIAKAAAGEFREAIDLFDQVLQVRPDFGEAYYQRGLAHFKLNQLAAAIADYSRSLLSDANPSLYYARALAHLSAGSLEAAVADAKDAIRLKPDYAVAYRLLGTVRQKQRQPEKAIASYKKAAELYLDLQDIANARGCLELARQLAPAPPSTPTLPPPLNPAEFLQRAVAKANQQGYSSAIEDLNWAIQIDPQDAQAYVCRAQLRAKAQDRWGAIADYRQAARLYLDRADKPMAQQLLAQIEQLKAESAQEAAKTTAPTYSRAISTRSTATRSSRVIRHTSTGRVSPAVQQKLLRLVGEDRKIAAGLVNRLRDKHPGMPEDWYWEKAIYDLERDRR